MANVFLDVTRLCRRLKVPTPDGVGRVEHAYLQWALRQPHASFVISGERRIDLLERDKAHRLFQTVTARWRGDPGAGDRAEEFRSELVASGYFEQPSAILRRRLRSLPDLPPERRRTILTRLLKAELDEQRRPLRKQLAAIARRYRLPGKGGPTGLASAIGVAAADKTIAEEIAADAPEARKGPPVPTPRLIREITGGEDALYVCVSLFPGEAPSTLNALRQVHPPLRSAIMLHDLIPATVGGPHGVEAAENVSSNLRNLHAGGSTIIANSDATRREYLGYASDTGLPACEIIVAPLGLPRRAPVVEPKAETAYFLALGSLVHRKNTDLLARIWPRLKDRMGAAAPRLIVVGAEPDPALGLGDRLRHNPAADLITVETGTSDDRLASLVSGARALLFPSFAEGWGFPLIEALAAGTPAICSDIPAFREAGRNLADYIDPLDGLGWLQAVENYAAKGSNERAAQCARIRNFRPLSWPDHFRIIETKLDITPPAVS